jgi:ribosomal-protein-alanine N-acetyltransferase
MIAHVPVRINETLEPVEKIETLRLVLTWPSNEAILALKNLWRNEKVRKFLGGIIADEIINQKINELQNHWELHKFGLWVVCEKISNQAIGVCGLHYSEDGIEISYMFFPEFWGKGFASEAVVASIIYGFNTLKIECIIAITQTENTKSCQLLKSIGMRYMSNFMRFNASQSLFELKRNECHMINSSKI